MHKNIISIKNKTEGKNKKDKLEIDLLIQSVWNLLACVVEWMIRREVE
jgi:hypothetical protein